MIGTVFLWIYWPSFVSALVPFGRERCAIHTVLALCGSAVCAFAASQLFEGKLNMVHIQNATLAGGVAIGTCADMELGLWAALLIGCVAGIWSTIGYVKISPFLEKFRIHDTCGIHNLHGMPGLMGGLASQFAILAGDAKILGIADDDRNDQARKQFMGMLATLGFAIGGGLLVGMIAKLYGEKDFADFEDAYWWTIDCVVSSEAEKPRPAAKDGQVAPSPPAPVGDVPLPTDESPAAMNVQEENGHGERSGGAHRAFVAVAALTQLVVCLFYLTFAQYGDAITNPASSGAGVGTVAVTENHYGVFMDVHVMIFIGFGYLMTFLKCQGFGSVGFNFLVAALAMEWAMVIVPMVNHGFHGDEGQSMFDAVKLDSTMLIEGDFAAAAVLITFGGLLGKVGPLHLIVIALMEVIIYSICFEVVAAKIETLDVGGSLVIHAFGAYFGLAASFVLTPPVLTAEIKADREVPKNGSSYNSDMFAMIGTVFLWLYWPSFVSALVPEAREVCALHTVLALCGSCVAAFAASYLFKGKLDMVHIQNATLAGGVAIGSTADMDIGLWGSLCIGTVAGVWSTFGYEHLTPILDKVGFHDTCGIHNLHGMPGVIGGLASVFAVAMGKAEHLHVNRTTGAQVGKQILGLVVAVTIGIAGGLFTGLVAKVTCPPLTQLFEDAEFWTVEDEDEISGVNGHSTSAENEKDAKQFVDVAPALPS
jgi:ammonium transporter Rh